jgi:hypothetical protein
MVDVVRIVRPDDADHRSISTGVGTQVLMPDGTPIPDISRINLTIAADEVLVANIEVAVAFTDIHAHPLLGIETLVEAAKAHGYRLVEDSASTLGDNRVRHRHMTPQLDAQDAAILAENSASAESMMEAARAGHQITMTVRDLSSPSRTECSCFERTGATAEAQ